MGVGESAVANLGVTPAFWRDKRVLLTGHTGFKGSWLALWLDRLGATVTGYANGVPTSPSLYEAARIGTTLESVEGDVCDLTALASAVEKARPDIVIHLAAQSLVRRSYSDAAATFATNVTGTVNLFEAVRAVKGIRVVLNVTSDKCYLNHGDGRRYRETDALGGSDPYSASKACSEIVTAAYVQSFFDAGPRVASARSGNALGGGDWAVDRLVPDLMRAALSGTCIRLRNPRHVRPWQHVLCPLVGYLQLVERLWHDPSATGAWNFGPHEDDIHSVAWIVERLVALWPEAINVQIAEDDSDHAHEAAVLRLDSSRARNVLHWQPGWRLEEALRSTVDWYLAVRAGTDIRDVTLAQLAAYERLVA